MNNSDFLLDGLNDVQKQAVKSTDGAVLVLAGAGSGKTRALTYRIAYLIKEKKISPYNILAITFTNKAAQEIIDRVDKLLEFRITNNESRTQKHSLPWLGTFHKVCGKILRFELNPSTALKTGADLPYSSNFVIYDTDDQKQVVKKCLKELELDPKKNNPSAILAYISGAKNELMSPKDYEPYASGKFQQVVAEVYKLYQKKLVSANAMDFDDMLMVTVKMFKKYPEILEKYQNLFKYILIDEYQDTNHAQYIFAKLLASKHNNIYVVGDDFQSIYAFRGANFKNILNFEKDYPQAKVFKLEQNYRSTKEILDAATGVILNNRNRTEKKLWTENKKSFPISVVELDSEQEEARFIAQEISVLLRNYPKLNDFAVLYRTNAQSRALEEALLAQELPYRIVGGVRFYERKEIKDIIAYLRLFINENDAVSFERIVNVPTRGIGQKTLQGFLNSKLKTSLEERSPLGRQNSNEIPPKIQDFLNLIENMRQESKSKTPAEIVEMIINKTGYKKWLDDGTIEGESRLENIKELITVASQYQTSDEFLETVALVQDHDQYDGSADAVTLMTLHSAKGLEFPAVFIAGMEEGIFPHSRSLMDSNELEEERRLCYVGITRAKERLYLISTRARRLWGSMQVNLRSRFIDEIPKEVMQEL